MDDELFDLNGAVALVIGAAGGTGRAVAIELQRAGADLLVADTSGSGTSLTHGHFGEVPVLEVDVTSEVSVNALMDRVVDLRGRVDVLVLAAHSPEEMRFTWKSGTAEWERVMAVDFWGVLHPLRRCLPHMIERDHGRVVVVSSMAGVAPCPAASQRAAAEHAVVGLVSSVCNELELLDSSVRVLLACPGFVRAEFTGAMPVANFDPSDVAERMAAVIRDRTRTAALGGMPAHEFAERLVDGVRSGQFWVFSDERHPAVLLANAARAKRAAPPLSPAHYARELG